MEAALFISTKNGLGFWKEGYRRLYYGNEFCSNLIPSPGQLEEVLDFVEEKKIDFSLVTGYATSEDIKKYEALFEILRKRLVKSEVIVNDWGIFELCQDFPMQRVLGRLLTKQKKGMRILSIMDKMPVKAMSRFQEISLNENFINFLSEHKVNRVEIDNLLQGYRINSGKIDISFSLYMPYAYITTTRLCPFNECNQEKGKVLRIPSVCSKSCRQAGYLELSVKQMPVKLLLKGNTTFYKSDKINLLSPNKLFNRIVFQPKLPF